MDATHITPTDTVRALSIEPLHEVRDTDKVAALAESMATAGWLGRPVLVYDDGNGLHALTGTHRIAAARLADIEVPVYVLDVVHQHEDGETCDECPICRLIDARDDDDRCRAADEIGGEVAELARAESEG